MRTKRIPQSIVLSASLGKGCYRHIRVSVNMTLEGLADVILRAFNFDNDHAHAFFMDNRLWSDDNCFYMAEVDMDNEYRHTCDFRVHSLGLQKGDVFKFLFDFGDCWEFQCKVLRIEDVDTKAPELVRAVGKAPEQYPEYEDEDGEEEE